MLSLVFIFFYYLFQNDNAMRKGFVCVFTGWAVSQCRRFTGAICLANKS